MDAQHQGAQEDLDQVDKTIFEIEQEIYPEAKEQTTSFLTKGLSPKDRIIRYAKDTKTGFQYICAKNDNLSFSSNIAHVILLPEDRENLIKFGNEIVDHGIQTGRFGKKKEAAILEFGLRDGEYSNIAPVDERKRILSDIVKGNTGEQAGITLLNSAFECFGLETKLSINTLKYDGRGDGGRDAVVGLYGIDFKYRNDVNEYTDLVVSSFNSTSNNILIHTHSVRRKDDKNYSDDYYLNVNDSSHIVIVRGGISGSRFIKEAGRFGNGRYVLDKSSEKLIPIWDLVLFLAIQAAKQEGHIE